MSHPAPPILYGSGQGTYVRAVRKTRLRAEAPWFAEGLPGLAGFFVAPMCFRRGLVSDAVEVLDVPGFADCRKRAQALAGFKTTDPGDAS